jgi:serine/threonine-protein kinase
VGGWVALLVVLLLAAGAAAGGWYLAVGRYTSTPALAGMTVAQARAQLGSSGLRLAVGTPAYSETVPRGDIISTDPAAGQRVLREGTVTVVVSKGKERYAMPPVLGTAEAEARAMLTEGGLAVGDVTRRYSEKVDEGLVVTASYEEGARLRPDTAVDLVVSRGQRPIRVPEVVGRSLRSARAALIDRGLRLSVSRTFDDAVPRGEVIGQEPADGTLFRGDEVALVVSKGPRMAEVPGVFGRYRDDAVATLESAGFAVDVQHADGYVGFDLVSSQSPSASEMAPRGSTVTIFLY